MSWPLCGLFPLSLGMSLFRYAEKVVSGLRSEGGVEGFSVSNPFRDPCSPEPRFVTALPTATVSVVSPQGPNYPGDRITLRSMPKPTVVMSMDTVYHGEAVTLTCVIEPSGGWKYGWGYKRWTSNDLSSLREPDTNTYKIDSADESNQGYYACRGKREGSRRQTTYSNTAEVKVKAVLPLPVSVLPQRLRLTEDNSLIIISVLILTALPTPVLSVEPDSPVFTGETVTLRCAIGNEDIWKYMWYKGQRNIAISDPSKTHVISNAAESHKGRYWCQGERKDRLTSTQRSNEITLNVRALPTATLTAVPQSPVFTGETVTMTCVIESLGGWTYKWYKEPSRVPVSEGNTFTFTSAAESDEGQYWCQGERRGRPTSSQRSMEMSLDVIESKPQLVNRKTQLFTGDSVTLTCELDITSGLLFYWYKDTQTSTLVAQTDGNSYSISFAKVSDGGQYWCRAGRGDPVYYTQYSNEVQLNVTERPRAVVTLKSNWTEFFKGETVSLKCHIEGGGNSKWQYDWYHNGKEIRPEKAKAGVRTYSQSWLAEGHSVKIGCEVEESSAGWRFSWFKVTSYKPAATSQRYQILPDSSRGAGGSYTLSPAALRHTGVYVCRAERGEPAYKTEFSQPQPLWVTGVSPNASVVSHSNWTQIFRDEPLSLRCGAQGNSTGWSLMWFTGRGGGSAGCPTGWRSETGSTCSTSSASSLDTGVYWCQSESGEQSSPVNITVHNGDVILENPVHPVMEGDPLTLRCRYRNQPSNISADFYKDGTLLHTSSTGEMTSSAVSKSHEGLYKCKNTKRGESPESWITVMPKITGSSISMAVGVLVGLVIASALVILLVLLYRKRKSKGKKNNNLTKVNEDIFHYYAHLRG
ncbi:basement membrane-specific heparan sulfate proteoglycan core protein-like [Engraulis encrasicolus]|uniref:basement membrane-specific heparan sulfate proteoglycan core protein-like n=1 Tax=Engraulis encrasicolus TaxID=184585 RepID=UPI002FD678F3